MVRGKLTLINCLLCQILPIFIVSSYLLNEICTAILSLYFKKLRQGALPVASLNLFSPHPPTTGWCLAIYSLYNWGGSLRLGLALRKQLALTSDTWGRSFFLNGYICRVRRKIRDHYNSLSSFSKQRKLRGVMVSSKWRVKLGLETYFWSPRVFSTLATTP